MKERQMKTVQDFGVWFLSELEDAGRYNTAHVYRAVFHRLKSFAGCNLCFSELTPGLLKRFEQKLFRQGCRRNTVSLYLRMIRAAYNHATQAGFARRMPSGLFAGVFTGIARTGKRAVSLSTLSRLYQADLQAHPRLDEARNLFLLSFYLRGIPFVDLINLRKSDVRGDRIHYCRSKTGSPLSVDIEPCIRELLHRYAAQSPGSPYLLPVLTAGGGRRDYDRYQSALRRYNRELAQLSGLLCLPVCLSSYVARHSWATIAYRDHTPVAEISESLGHASEKITYHYLAGFENSELRKINRRLIALVRQDERVDEKSTKKPRVRHMKRSKTGLENENRKALSARLGRLYERWNPLLLLGR